MAAWAPSTASVAGAGLHAPPPPGVVTVVMAPVGVVWSPPRQGHSQGLREGRGRGRGRGQGQGQGQGQAAAREMRGFMDEVLSAIDSLYSDELKPIGRILRKRLGELAGPVTERLGKKALKMLRETCEACAWLNVRTEEGGDWSVVIAGRPERFVDVHTPEESYPASLWREAAAYFDSLNDTDKALPGGRYEAAQALLTRGLPFLAGRSLGQVCHIVQLAISSKSLLGYRSGKIVPYRLSQSVQKAEFAEQRRIFSGAGDEELPVATWETLLSGMRQLMADLAPGHGGGQSYVVLAGIKRLFQTQLGLNLSETALGHGKLMDLFRDDRLQGICKVELRHVGHVVVAAHQAASYRRISLFDHVAQTHAAAQASSTSNTQLPIHGVAPRSRPFDAFPRRACSSAESPASRGEGSSEATTPTSTTPSSGRRQVETSTPSSSRTADVDDCSAIPSLAFPPTPSPWSPCASWPCWPAPSPISPARGNGSCEVVAEDMAVLENDSTPARPVLMTPSRLGRFGFKVQNTFIHDACLPSSPMCASFMRRSRSSPLDRLECPRLSR